MYGQYGHYFFFVVAEDFIELLNKPVLQAIFFP